jgi:hypothetical protein
MESIGSIILCIEYVTKNIYYALSMFAVSTHTESIEATCAVLGVILIFPTVVAMFDFEHEPDCNPIRGSVCMNKLSVQARSWG